MIDDSYAAKGRNEIYGSYHGCEETTHSVIESDILL